MLRFTRVLSELSASTVTIRAGSIPPPAGTVHSTRRASAAPGTVIVLAHDARGAGAPDRDLALGQEHRAVDVGVVVARGGDAQLGAIDVAARRPGLDEHALAALLSFWSDLPARRAAPG